MIWAPFSEGERRQLLTTREDALRRYHDEMERAEGCRPASEAERAAVAAAEVHMAATRQAEMDYFDRLPRVVMGCCPFDGKPLVRTFDPFGLDGPWWRPDATTEEPSACPHFCLVRGAVMPSEGHSGGAVPAHAGPTAPYVIPRILDLPGMVAVISQLEMAGGERVYPIAYFAKVRPPVQQLAANWPRGLFLYTTALGQHLWRPDEPTRDFDLRPWIAREKLRWCEPGLNNERLSSSADLCPFVDLFPEVRPNLPA